MKTLLIALLLSAMLFDQSSQDDEQETPISFVAVFLFVACVTFLMKKLKASEPSNAARPTRPEELE